MNYDDGASDSDGGDTFEDAAEWTTDYPAPDPALKGPQEQEIKGTPKPAVEGEEESAPSFMVTNLKTGEICALKDVPEKFPEAALSLRDLQQAAGSGVEHSDPSSTSGRSTGTDNPEDTNVIKEKLGFRGMMKSQVKKKMSKLNKKLGTLRNIRTLNDGNADNIKVKVKKKMSQQLSELREVQCLHLHSGPIWTFAFSGDGVFMASGGADSIVRIWVVKNTPEGKKHAEALAAKNSPEQKSSNSTENESGGKIFHPVPYKTFHGHKADVIDLSWSKTRFLLTASIDKTVRLWHVSRDKCLSIFQHPDLVTSVKFHPQEDRFFLSGSFDKRLRIWNIPEHRVVEWQQTSHVITSATFSPAGDTVVIGLYDGQVVFFATENLKYQDQCDCRNRHGKHRKGKKVTGVVFSPDGSHLLVTTNDSRVRLIDVKEKTVVSKIKGMHNEGLQIRAFFGEDGNSVISGSEDQHVYVWTSISNSDKTIMARNDCHESFRAGTDTVTCAQFCPRALINHSKKPRHMIISSGFNGELKIFQNTGLSRQLTRPASNLMDNR